MGWGKLGNQGPAELLGDLGMSRWNQPGSKAPWTLSGTREAPLRHNATKALSPAGLLPPEPCLYLSHCPPTFGWRPRPQPSVPAPVSPVVQPATRASRPAPGAACCWTGRGLAEPEVADPAAIVPAASAWAMTNATRVPCPTGRACSAHPWLGLRRAIPLEGCRPPTRSFTLLWTDCALTGRQGSAARRAATRTPRPWAAPELWPGLEWEQ